jgi:hypothetical protein
MARRTFFSFHHSGDSWRAGQVRNSWITQDRESAGFWDAVAWEAVKKKDIATVQAWIDEQMKGTSVMVVLIGAETSTRPHVNYEIKESHRLGKGMLGIYVHNMKDVNGKTGTKGSNPFASHFFEKDGKKVYFSEIYPTYDWVNDDGRNKIGDWIEAAAKKAGR